jgi:hypothetical protein
MNARAGEGTFKNIREVASVFNGNRLKGYNMTEQVGY